jgi:hypothetical protein
MQEEAEGERAVQGSNRVFKKPEMAREDHGQIAGAM